MKDGFFKQSGGNLDMNVELTRRRDVVPELGAAACSSIEVD